jgi:hypothetical protein
MATTPIAIIQPLGALIQPIKQQNARLYEALSTLSSGLTLLSNNVSANVTALTTPGTSSGLAVVTIQDYGTLAIETNVAPIMALNTAKTATAVSAFVKIAATGATIVLNINVGGVLWMSLTLAAGATFIAANATQISNAIQIPANAPITLDIVSVGTVIPGSDLSLFIYF